MISEVLADEQDQRSKGDRGMIFFRQLLTSYQRLGVAAEDAVAEETFINRLAKFAVRVRTEFDYQPLFDVSIADTIDVVSFEEDIPHFVDPFLNQPEVTIYETSDAAWL